MKATNSPAVVQRWTASELRKLPTEAREAALKAAAALAEDDYRKDKGLTAFEAFGQDEIYGESSSAETRRNLAD